MKRPLKSVTRSIAGKKKVIADSDYSCLLVPFLECKFHLANLFHRLVFVSIKLVCMKKRVSFFLLIFIPLFNACNNKSADIDQGHKIIITKDTASGLKNNSTENKYLIRDMQAGPFKIGDEIPGPATMMTYQMRKEQQTRNTEEGPVTEPVTIISENGEDLLMLKPGFESGNYNNSINEIIILSSKYRTAEDIGVGSTIESFQKVYPDHKAWYTYVSEMFVIETPLVKAQFLLDPRDYTGPKPRITSERTTLKTSDFIKSGMITQVRII